MSEPGATRHARHDRPARPSLHHVDERAPLATRPAADAVDGRRRSVRTLFAAWAVYWLALLAVQLWPAVVQWWAVRRREHGTITLSLAGDFSEGVAWFAIPPLVMTIVWLLWNRRKR
jgi:hypothetical protein